MHRVVVMFVLALRSLVGSVAGTVCSEDASCHASGGTHQCTRTEDATTLLQAANQINRPAVVQIQKAKVPAGLKKELKPGDINKSNIIYIKVPKTGSSTASGIVRNIAAHHNLTGAFIYRGWPSEQGEPGIWADHGALDAADYGPDYVQTRGPGIFYADNYPDWNAVQALKSPTFMWTMIRDPVERARSLIYWGEVHFMYLTPMTKYLQLFSMAGDEQFRYIRHSAEATVHEVVNTYGLIGVLERYDDSLVVLAATLKVPLSELLYLRAKDTSTGYKDENGRNQHKKPPFSEEPKAVQHYLNTDFREKQKHDYELYDLVNKTLDAKIAEMKLEPAIRAFKSLLANAQKECYVPGTDKKIIEDTVKCYVRDFGCNYECFNKFDDIGRQMCTWC